LVCHALHVSHKTFQMRALGGFFMERVTAIFDDRSRAQAAIDRLRSAGIGDSKLSIVGSHDGVTNDAEEMMNKDVTDGATKGLAVGASAGVLFGIAAALIPGVGPFITAGVLASTLGAVGGGAVAGAVVGGVTGTLAGAFAQAGYDKDEADYYGDAVQKGNYMVAVDAIDAAEAMKVREVLNSSSARYYERASNTMMGSNPSNTTGMGR
jgi:hypothetical protein